jgi:carbamate kinase
MISPSLGQAPGTLVVALGGNALLPPGEQGEIAQQFAHTRESLGAVVALARAGWRVAIVHGNGPQIGDELLRNERAGAELPPLPLGVLVAGTAGWIGYMIQQSLQNALERAGVRRDVVTLITQVVVDPEDPASREPDKPIGRTMEESTARAVEAQLGWQVARSGDGWRRVVPSPAPLEIVEIEQVRRLVAEGSIVICLGGGGTPVCRDSSGCLDGIDAVIDKDRAAQVLACGIGADVFLVLTNVDGVYRDFGSPTQTLLSRITGAQAREMLDAGHFGRGSMAPKMEAALAFVEGSSGRACIARLDQGLDAVEGRAGTTVVP